MLSDFVVMSGVNGVVFSSRAIHVIQGKAQAVPVEVLGGHLVCGGVQRRN
jgi:hypothetical protein